MGAAMDGEATRKLARLQRALETESDPAKRTELRREIALTEGLLATYKRIKSRMPTEG